MAVVPLNYVVDMFSKVKGLEENNLFYFNKCKVFGKLFT